MGFAQFSFLFKATQSPLGSRHFKSSKLLFIKAAADLITTHEHHHTTSKSQTLLSSLTNTSTPPGRYSTFNADSPVSSPYHHEAFRKLSCHQRPSRHRHCARLAIPCISVLERNRGGETWLCPVGLYGNATICWLSRRTGVSASLLLGYFLAIGIAGMKWRSWICMEAHGGDRGGTVPVVASG